MLISDWGRLEGAVDSLLHSNRVFSYPCEEVVEKRRPWLFRVS